MRLATLKQQLGDAAGAQQARAAALQLAHNYTARAGFKVLTGIEHVKTGHNPRRAWTQILVGLALAARPPS